MKHRLASSARFAILVLASIGSLRCAVEHDPALAGDWLETTNGPWQPTPSIAALESHTVFGADGSLSQRVTRTYASGSPSRASCVETFVGSGPHWWTEAPDRLRLSGSFTVTQARTGCANASDDRAEGPATDTDVIPAVGTDDTGLVYRVEGGALTLSNASGVLRTYARP